MTAVRSLYLKHKIGPSLLERFQNKPKSGSGRGTQRRRRRSQWPPVHKRQHKRVTLIASQRQWGSEPRQSIICVRRR